MLPLYVSEKCSWGFYVSAQDLLQQHSGLFFAPLSLVLINDSSARCRKMAALAIKALLAQVNVDHQNSLFTLVNTWLNADKVRIPRLKDPEMIE